MLYLEIVQFSTNIFEFFTQIIDRNLFCTWFVIVVQFHLAIIYLINKYYIIIILIRCWFIHFLVIIFIAVISNYLYLADIISIPCIINLTLTWLHTDDDRLATHLHRHLAWKCSAHPWHTAQSRPSEERVPAAWRAPAAWFLFISFFSLSFFCV